MQIFSIIGLSGQAPCDHAAPSPDPSASEGALLTAAGIAFNWLGNVLAAVFLAIGLFKMFGAPGAGDAPLVPLAILCAILSWVASKALRHMLSGDCSL